MIESESFSTVVSSSRDIEHSKRAVYTRLRSVVKKLDKGTLSFYYLGRPIRAQKIDIIRVLSQVKCKNKVELGIRNIIIDGIMSGESIAVGSGYLSLKILLGMTPDIFNKGKLRLEKKEVKQCVSELMRMGATNEVVDTIIERASISSGIIVGCSEAVDRIVVRGKPSLTVLASFHEIFVTKREKIESGDLIVIDGFIESIGMIDSILQSFSKEKKSLVIIARGFAPDVVSTLFKNYRAGNMFVYPLVLQGGPDIFEKLDNIKNFYNIHNILSIRTLSVNDFDFDKDFLFRKNSIDISGVDSIERICYITFPIFLKNVSGILEDRINLGLRIAREAAMSGKYSNIDNLGNLSIYSRHATKTARRVYKSLVQNINNLKCMVLQEE